MAQEIIQTSMIALLTVLIFSLIVFLIALVFQWVNRICWYSDRITEIENERSKLIDSLR